MHLQALRNHLRSLEERLLQPATRKSAGAVNELLADDFMEFGRTGRIFNKQQIIEALARETPQEMTLSNFRITPLAPDVILATSSVIQYDPEEPSPVHSLRSSIWKLIQGRWQMVFHQGTIIHGS